MTGGAVLTPAFASLILFGVFFGLLALRVPVAFALGLACLPILVVEDRLSQPPRLQECRIPRPRPPRDPSFSARPAPPRDPATRL